MLVIGAPPVAPGVKSTVSWPLWALIPVMVGADGAMALTMKLTGCDVACASDPLAATCEMRRQVPAETKVTWPVVEPTVHTSVVWEV